MAIKVTGPAVIAAEPKFRTNTSRKTGSSYETATLQLATDRKLMRFDRGDVDIFTADVYCTPGLKERLKMGALIQIDGFLIKDQWDDKSGRHVETYKLKVEQLYILLDVDGKPDMPSVNATPNASRTPAQGAVTEESVTDDDVPF